jgi:hypothetical protein
MIPTTDALAPVTFGDISVPFDPRLGVYCVFAVVSRPQVVFLKVLLESYEGLGIARSIDPHFGDGLALTCLLAVPDSIDYAVRVYEELADLVGLKVL